MDNMRAFAAMYDEKLKELTFNSKPIITNLSLIAKQNMVYAESVVNLVVKRILGQSAGTRLPLIYLMDSILKNCRGAYVHFFGLHVAHVIVHTYINCQKADIQTRLAKLVNTWDPAENREQMFTPELRNAIRAQLPPPLPEAPSSAALPSSSGFSAASSSSSSQPLPHQYQQQQQHQHYPPQQQYNPPPSAHSSQYPLGPMNGPGGLMMQHNMAPLPATTGQWAPNLVPPQQQQGLKRNNLVSSVQWVFMVFLILLVSFCLFSCRDCFSSFLSACLPASCSRLSPFSDSCSPFLLPSASLFRFPLSFICLLANGSDSRRT